MFKGSMENNIDTIFIYDVFNKIPIIYISYNKFNITIFYILILKYYFLMNLNKLYLYD